MKPTQKFKIFKAEKLRTYWSLGKKLTLNKKKYRVGRMSYGAYFLEPGKARGETTPFNKGTLWFEKINADTYVLDSRNMRSFCANCEEEVNIEIRDESLFCKKCGEQLSVD